MKYDFVVLGATGEEGSIAARDLLESGHSVLLCGRNRNRIKDLIKHPKGTFAYVDLRDIEATAKTLKSSGAKIAVNCSELRWNINAMQACLKAGLHYLDLGGLQEMTKRQYKLSSSYKRKKLIALLGCGSTPGTSNVMAAYAVMHLDSVKHIELGFAWDSNIKEFVLPYSIESIAHELLTPPIVLQNGKFIKRKACDMEGITMFRAVGKQATYCIVHSEVFTFARYFKKKGLKDVHYRAGFPEHSYRVIEMLLKYGFTSKEPIKVHDVEIRPVDVTRELLKNVDKPKGYKEVEDIWVKVDGMKDGKETRIEMDCVVQTKKGWEEYGSNIDTGMTISIMAQMLHNGLIKGTGVTAPEAVVPPEPFFRELTLRGMQIYLNEKEYLGEKDGIR